MSRGKYEKRPSTKITDWTQHTPESFLQYVYDVANYGATECLIVLEGDRNYDHLCRITWGQKYPIPVKVLRSK